MSLVTPLHDLILNQPGRRLQSISRRPFSSLPPGNPLLVGKVVCGAIAVACSGVSLLANNASPRPKPPIRDRPRPIGERGQNEYTLGDYERWRKQARRAPNYTLADFLRDPIGTTSAVLNMDFFINNLVLSVRNIDQGRYWTLLTHTFTHFGIVHLFFNMYGLWGFGPATVAWYGLGNFAGLWITSGVAGGIASIVTEKYRLRTDPQRKSMSVGASASVLGILVASLMPRLHTPLMVMFIVSSACNPLGHPS